MGCKGKAIDGSNWYSYCNNDPVNNIDPSGLSWISNLWSGLKDIVSNVTSVFSKKDSSKTSIANYSVYSYTPKDSSTTEGSSTTTKPTQTMQQYEALHQQAEEKFWAEQSPTYEHVIYVSEDKSNFENFAVGTYVSSSSNFMEWSLDTIQEGIGKTSSSFKGLPFRYSSLNLLGAGIDFLLMKEKGWGTFKSALHAAGNWALGYTITAHALTLVPVLTQGIVGAISFFGATVSATGFAFISTFVAPVLLTLGAIVLTNVIIQELNKKR